MLSFIYSGFGLNLLLLAVNKRENHYPYMYFLMSPEACLKICIVAEKADLSWIFINLR